MSPSTYPASHCHHYVLTAVEPGRAPLVPGLSHALDKSWHQCSEATCISGLTCVLDGLRFTDSSNSVSQATCVSPRSACPRTNSLLPTAHSQLQAILPSLAQASTAQQVPKSGTWEGSWSPPHYGPLTTATEPAHSTPRGSCHAHQRTGWSPALSLTARPPTHRRCYHVRGQGTTVLQCGKPSLWNAASPPSTAISGHPGQEAPRSGPGVTEAVRGSRTRSALPTEGREGFYIILALFMSLNFSKNKQTRELLPLTTGTHGGNKEQNKAKG